MGELSRREMEVIELVANGMSDVQIGRRLGTQRTVGKHLEHIYRKSETSNRTEAVAKLIAASPLRLTFSDVFSGDTST